MAGGTTTRDGNRRTPWPVKLVLKSRAIPHARDDISRYFRGRAGRVLMRPPTARELAERAVTRRARMGPRRAMRANAGVAVHALVVFSAGAGRAFASLPGAGQDRTAREVAGVFDEALETDVVGLAVSTEDGRPWIRVLLDSRRRDTGESVLHAHSQRWETTERVAHVVCAAIAAQRMGTGHGEHRDGNS